jgi:hypothetical protein
LQALYLLNNDFALKRAEAFAKRVRDKAGDDRGKQTETAFRLALGRTPDAEERKLAAAFFDEAGDDALVPFCQAVLNLNEFAYLE